MNKKTVNINNFIGTYDGYITQEECNKAIKLFDSENKFNKTINRQSFEQTSVLKKQDQQFFAGAGNIEVWRSNLNSLLVNFDIALKHYEINTGIKEIYDIKEFHYTQLKIQKTLPTEGYHVWHIEHGKGFDDKARALVFSVYLNDVKEGGETEFLHFSKRVKPKAGRIVIWPAGFPYLHRGNPPLSGEKYLLTSWLLLN
tara:strand:- start:665 stop:1261 length:597 start_codon:yes stop_codon:yes gene_type:complete